MRERLVTKQEAAELLAISQRSVERLIDQHALPAVKLGASVRIRPADLDRLVERSRGAGQG